MLLAPTQPVHVISCDGRVFGTHVPQFQKSVVFAFPERKSAAVVSNHIRRFGLAEKIDFVPASRFRMAYNPGSPRRALDKQLIQLRVLEHMDLVMANQAHNIDTFLVDDLAQTPRGALLLDGAFVAAIDRGDILGALAALYDKS